MSDIQRICAQCGQGNPVEARFCARCGYDSEGALAAPPPSLPAVLGKAALPVLIGAASLALRAGWRLLQSKAAQEIARNAARQAVQVIQQPPASTQQETLRPSPRTRRTIRIRSTWAMGDANGVWRQGSSEQTIEIDE